MRNPTESPLVSSRGWAPGRAAVGGDFDTGDDASNVGCRAGDGDFRPIDQRLTVQPGRDYGRRSRFIRRLRGRYQPRRQRGRLSPHICQ